MVPEAQIQEHIVQVGKVIPQERSSERILEQIGDIFLHQVVEESVPCELSLRSAFTVALALQIVDFPVVHVFERIMKGIVGVAEVVPQECLQRTVEEMGDVPESQLSNARDRDP